MSFSDDVKSAVDTVLSASWTSRDGTVVPTTDDITLKNGSVNIDATYLYADLADSSSLAQKLKKDVAAKIVRSYLDATSRVIKKYDGEIRSFDGDRVMAIFIGSSKNTSAVRAALALNWVIDEVVKPKIKAKWGTIEEFWIAKHGVGVDTGAAMLVRGGVRNSNDIVSIGAAPNVAAKLSDLRCHKLHITKSTYDNMDDSNKLSNDKSQNRWTKHSNVIVGDKTFEVLSSGWWWSP